MTVIALGSAFVQGLISSLSACVYPLIPVTTAIFGAGKTDNLKDGLLLSGIYVGGMSLTYVALGLAAALGGTVFGSYLGKPEVILSFAAFFIILGLWFMGIINIPLPDFGNKLTVKKTSTLLYPLILGIFSGFIAAPCTAPMFGALLIEITRNAATNQSIVPGVVQSLAFSLGMGLPFLLIGGFALKLPKPGPWLKGVKYIGATVLFTAALHYIEDLYGPYPSSRLWMYAGMGVMIFIVFMILTEPFSANEPKNYREKSYIVLFLAISAYGLFLATSPLANQRVDDSHSVSDQSQHDHGSNGEAINEIIWYTSLEEGMKKAQEVNGTLLIDFWAQWCSACHEMEKHLFHNERFVEIIHEKNLIPVRLDVTTPDEKYEELRLKYGIIGLPTLIIADKNGEKIGSILGFKDSATSIKKLLEALR